jgi:hypothetical protein
MKKSEPKPTVERTVGRESDKFMLRFPDGMRDRIADQAKLNNRSMNAEIVARLEQSFDGPVKQSEVEELLQKLSERDDTAQKVAERDRLLSLTAIFMRLVIDCLPDGNDELTKEMLDLVRRYSNNAVHGNFEGAIVDAVSLVDLGIRYGIIEKNTEEQSFPRLPEYQGRRRSPITFEEPVETGPHLPSKTRRKLKT